MQHGLNTSGTVVKVIDGDTVIVEIKQHLVIRLVDPDNFKNKKYGAKELKSGGEVAKAKMEELVLNKEIDIHIPKFGDEWLKSLGLNRILGVLYNKDGLCINTAMEKLGLILKNQTD